MRRSYPTMWEFLLFGLKWQLLFVLASGVALWLLLSPYPLASVVPVILYAVLFVRDSMRQIDRMDPRRAGDPWPRKLGRMLFGWAVFAVVLYLFGSALAVLLLISLAVLGLLALLAPIAAYRGWGYSRLERHLHRPRFDDPRFRSSRDSGVNTIP
jgi:hypothetical protein